MPEMKVEATFVLGRKSSYLFLPSFLDEGRLCSAARARAVGVYLSLCTLLLELLLCRRNKIRTVPLFFLSKSFGTQNPAAFLSRGIYLSPVLGLQ